MESIQDIEITSEMLLGFVYTYGLRLVGGLFTLFVGLWLAAMAVNLLKRALQRSDVDPSLQSFLTSLISALLKILIYITALGVLGVHMTSFIALLGAAGLAVGMALSGTLQNFAGGVMILFFKTFRVGDTIEAQGHLGTVKEIQIFFTIITTPDNRTVILPNGPLATETLVNISTQPIRRLEWTYALSYGDDIDRAKAVVADIIASDGRILDNPEPFYAVAELTTGSVNLVVRAWVNSVDYGGVLHDFHETVYKRFPEEGLNFARAERNVHLYQEK